MCPQTAAEKIDNLLISVNESGCSTVETLLAAYKELNKIIFQKKGERGGAQYDVVIADGY